MSNNKQKMSLLPGHRFVDLNTKGPRFREWARKLDPEYVISAFGGQIYLNRLVEKLDGTFEVKAVIQEHEQWTNVSQSSAMSSQLKKKSLGGPVQLVDKPNTWNSGSSWANEVENSSQTLGNSASYSQFGKGASAPAPSMSYKDVALGNDKVENKDEEDDPKGKPKYWDLLGGVDVVRVVCSHHEYRAGQAYPRPPSWEEYKQLVFDIMKINPDDIEGLVTTRYGVQAGAWMLSIRLKTNYNLKKTYEKCNGCFRFGVDSDTRMFKHRWNAEIEGFDPDKNIEKQKFKLRLNKEVGVKPQHVLSAAKRVMKVVGRGILKERYPKESGLVDSSGQGLGTGFYYFFAAKEDDKRFPEFLNVNGYRIRIWTPERDEELEKKIQEDPNYRRNRRNPDESRNEMKSDKPSKPKEQSEPKVIPDFMPNYVETINDKIAAAKEQERVNALIAAKEKDDNEAKDGNLGANDEKTVTPQKTEDPQGPSATSTPSSKEKSNVESKNEASKLASIEEETNNDEEMKTPTANSDSESDGAKGYGKRKEREESLTEIKQKAAKFVRECIDKKDPAKVNEIQNEIDGEPPVSGAGHDDNDEDLDESLNFLSPTELEKFDAILTGQTYDDRIQRFNAIIKKKQSDIRLNELLWIIKATDWKTDKGNPIISKDRGRLLSYYRVLVQNKDKALEQLQKLAASEKSASSEDDTKDSDTMNVGEEKSTGIMDMVKNSLGI